VPQTEAGDGDWEASPHYAGTSAAVIREVDPVAAILARLAAEADAALARAAGVGRVRQPANAGPRQLTK
jgi:hypothetical protein